MNVVVMGVIFKTGAEPGWCWVFLSSAEEGISLGVKPSQVGLGVLSYTPPSCSLSLVGTSPGLHLPTVGSRASSHWGLNFISLTLQKAEDSGCFPENPTPDCSTPRTPGRVPSCRPDPGLPGLCRLAGETAAGT